MNSGKEGTSRDEVATNIYMDQSHSANDTAQDKWRQLQDVFEHCVDLSESEQEAFLQKNYPDKPILQHEVRELLESYRASESELERSPFGSIAAESGSEELPEVAGYEILQALHRGGQGTVYLAIQKSTKREVALKSMLAGRLAGKTNKLRFEREVELISHLQHPGLVPVFDSGLANNQYFYVMEYIDGLCLDEYVSSQSLSIREVLGLFVEICSAVNFAQQRGVIHRDLKPTNILVDKEGRPRVVDFGLAKSIDNSVGSMPTVSMTGQLMGTLAYMSPEQASGKLADIDTRSDVYSLGVVLYQLLAGDLPYALDFTLAENLTAIQSEDPDTRPLRESGADSELMTIILKALQKEKHRRYPTAGAMGDDLSRYLAGEPIEAKRDSTTYIVRKLLRKKWKTAVASLAFLVLVAVSSIVSFGLYLSAVSASKKADETASLYERQRDKGLEQLYLAEMNLAGQSMGQTGGVKRIKQLVDSWAGKRSNKDPRGWEWYFLESLCDREYLSLEHGRDIWTLRWHPTEDRILFGDELGDVWTWDLTGKKQCFGRVGIQVRSVDWSCEGTFFAASGPDGPVSVWRESDQSSILKVPHENHVLSIAWHPSDDEVVAFGEISGLIRLWNVVEQKEILQFETGYNVQTIHWTDDGNQLVFASPDNRMQVWNIDPPKLAWENTDYDRPVFSAQTHCSHDLIATSGVGGDIAVIDGSENRVIWRYNTNRLNTNLHWSPNGEKFASVGVDRVLRLFEGKRNFQITTFEGHADQVWALDWKPNSTFIATGSQDGTIKIWDSESVRPQRVVQLPFPERTPIRSIDWQPDGNAISVAGLFTGVLLVDASSGETIDILPIGKSDTEQACWSPDGKFLAACGHGTLVEIWDFDRHQLASSYNVHADDTTKLQDQPKIVKSVAWSHDMQLAASCSQFGHLLIWEFDSGKVLRRQTESWLISTVDWHPSEQKVAYGYSSGQAVKVWDIRSDSQPRAMMQFESNVIMVRWSPDGRKLAASSKDGTVIIADANNPAEKFVLGTHTSAVTELAWSPDGGRLATASRDSTIRIWDTAEGAQTMAFKAHDSPVLSVAWSPDGKQLVSASTDGYLKFWDASLGYERTKTE